MDPVAIANWLTVVFACLVLALAGAGVVWAWGALAFAALERIEHWRQMRAYERERQRREQEARQP